MKSFDLAIVGGGLASARAIKSFRESGGEGSIALFSKDSTLPYHRPPLSKKFLRGETDEEPLVEDEQFYVDNGVEVMLETSVESVDAQAHELEVGGERVGYGKLLLATGAWPRTLQIPGADLDGIFTLRTVGNSKAIRDAAAGAERAVVVGAGFIGMEVAASLRQIGKEVSLVHLGRWLFDQLGVEQLSDELAALYESKGVELVLGNEVEAFHGNGSLEKVTTTNGALGRGRFRGRRDRRRARHRLPRGQRDRGRQRDRRQPALRDQCARRLRGRRRRELLRPPVRQAAPHRALVERQLPGHRSRQGPRRGRRAATTGCRSSSPRCSARRSRSSATPSATHRSSSTAHSATRISTRSTATTRKRRSEP